MKTQSSFRRKMRERIVPEMKAYNCVRDGSHREDRRTQKAYENFKRPAYGIKKGEKR